MYYAVNNSVIQKTNDVASLVERMYYPYRVPVSSWCCFENKKYEYDGDEAYYIEWTPFLHRIRPTLMLQYGDIAAIVIRTKDVLTGWFTHPELRQMGLGTKLIKEMMPHINHVIISYDKYQYYYSQKAVQILVKLGWTYTSTVTTCILTR
jgi:hypothetical protein